MSCTPDRCWSWDRRPVAPLRRMVCCIVAILIASCAHSTPPFLDESGAPLSGSIAEETYLPMPGSEQYLLVRGRHRRNPILLFVHGGPGGSETALMRLFQAELEDRFVMAYWDQRAAGKSYRSDISPGSMTIRQFVADMDQVVDHLRRRLQREQVFVLGHSWGATLGMVYSKEFPQKVAGFIGVGQPSSPEVERHAYEFVLREAERRGDHSVVDDLIKNGPPPYRTQERLHVRDQALYRYGGYDHVPLSRWSIVWRALWLPEIGLGDLFRLWKGMLFSQEAFAAELADFDLTKAVPALDVPVTFLLGRFDQRTWAPLAEQYLSQLHAPSKRVLWLERSGHNGPFEEPVRFRELLLEAIEGPGNQILTP